MGHLLMNEHEIGLRLRSERKRQQLTQAQFGKQGGVSLSSQNAYESGLHFPDARYLTRIAELGVDLNYILLGNRTDSISLSESEALAFSEIARVVHEWAGTRSKPLAPESQAHLILTFFEQYQSTSQLNFDRYTQTLKLVGG